mmetsp:Transcript_7150/g.13226  ORF Transcript_7150/g.13226 Transcript_7150/m.13226 type:complete len:361 (-) Transcript_7150:39-1121(-)
MADFSDASSSDARKDMLWYEKIACRMLRLGPTPKHIAFIMDGNRRYAKMLHVDRIVGHRRGYQTLLNVLKWCNQLEVKVATVYAFAMGNFNRSKHEVDSLMELALQKFAEMLDSQKEISQYGVRVKVIGDLERLPKKLRYLMAKVMKSTRGHTKVTLQIAFAYSAKQEMADAAASIARGIEDGALVDTDISQSLIDQCMYTSGQPLPELLIRTSGETRLSDFLTTQCRRGTCLSFIRPLWPEFTFWNFFAVIFMYQRHHSYLASQRTKLARLEARSLSTSDSQNDDKKQMMSTKSLDSSTDADLVSRIEDGYGGVRVAESTRGGQRVRKFLESRAIERERCIDFLANCSSGRGGCGLDAA